MNILKIIATSLIILSGQGIYAQKTMKDVWKEMPDSILPIMNSSIRSDIVDNDNVDENKEGIKNLLGGELKLVSLNYKFIDVRLSEKSGVQLLLLKKDTGTDLICMNRYYGNPAAESDVDFYTIDWTPVDTEKNVVISARDDFYSQVIDSLKKETGKKEPAVLDPIMIVVSLSDKENGELTFNTYVPLKISTDVDLPDFKMQRCLKWDGRCFK